MKKNARNGWLWLAVFLLLMLAQNGCQTVPTTEEPAPVEIPEEAEPETAAEQKPVEPEPEPIVEPEPTPVSMPKKSALAAQFETIGATATRNQEENTWQVTVGDDELVLLEGSRKAILNGVTYFLDETFEKRRGRWSLGESDRTLLLHLLSEKASKVKLASKTIVIDPGHGGSEDGASNEALGLLEKDMALDLAVRLQELLQAAGFKVVMTRFNDRLVSLEDRTRIANRSNAGMFISLHFNGSTNPDAKGIETFVLSPAGYQSTDVTETPDEQLYPGNEFDKESLILAWGIHTKLVRESQRVDRGLKKARFGVLKGLECPGVLIEGGFLTHKDEALFISTPVYRQRLAENIGAAIIEAVELPKDSDSS